MTPGPVQAPTFAPPQQIASPTHSDQLDVLELQTNDVQFRGLMKSAAFQGIEQDVWQRTESNLLIEQGKPEARMAVMDQFGMTMTASGFEPGHGEFTSLVAQQGPGLSEADILRVDNSHQPATLPLPHPANPEFSSELDRYITGSYAGFAETTAENLEAIHESHPSVTTVSHSQGVGAPLLSSSLYQQARQDPEFAHRLGEELGLEAGAFGTSQGPHSPQAAAAISQHVQDRLSSSPEATQGVERLQQTLGDLDGKVRYFSSAGNEGEFQDMVAQGGFVFDPRFQGTVQNEVALTESIGSAVPVFNSAGEAGAMPTPYTQRAPVDAAAIGTARFSYDVDGPGPLEAVEMLRRGTSYSTPLAGGFYAANPGAYQNLSDNAIPPVSGAENLGVGLLDISM